MTLKLVQSLHCTTVMGGKKQQTKKSMPWLPWAWLPCENATPAIGISPPTQRLNTLVAVIGVSPPTPRELQQRLSHMPLPQSRRSYELGAQPSSACYGGFTTRSPLQRETWRWHRPPRAWGVPVWDFCNFP